MRRLSAERLCRAQVKSITAPAPFMDLAMRVIELEEALQRRKRKLLRGREAFNAATQIMDRGQKELLREALGLGRQARQHSAQDCFKFQDAMRAGVLLITAAGPRAGLSPLWHSLQC